MKVVGACSIISSLIIVVATQSRNVQYFAVPGSTMTLDGAKALCTSRGGALATIMNAVENAAAAKEVMSGGGKDYWTSGQFTCDASNAPKQVTWPSSTGTYTNFDKPTVNCDEKCIKIECKSTCNWRPMWCNKVTSGALCERLVPQTTTASTTKRTTTTIKTSTKVTTTRKTRTSTKTTTATRTSTRFRNEDTTTPKRTSTALTSKPPASAPGPTSTPAPPCASRSTALTQTKSYFLIKGSFGWHNASVLCIAKGGRLASINSLEDQKAAEELTVEGTQLFSCSGFWTSGRFNKVKNVTFWANDNSAATFTNWYTLQPDGDVETDETCIRIDYTGKWDDVRCNEKLEGALCECHTTAVSTTTTRPATTPLKLTTALLATPKTTKAATNPPAMTSTQSQETTLQEEIIIRPPDEETEVGLVPPYLVPSPTAVIARQYPSDLAPEKSPAPQLTSDSILRVCPDLSHNLPAPKNGGHPTLARPVFSIDRIVGFSDMEESITVNAFFYLKWNATTCEKRKVLIGKVDAGTQRERVFVPSLDDVWLPDYYFTSSSRDIFMKDKNLGADLLMTLLSNEKFKNWPFVTLDFYYLRLGFFKTRCPIDLTKFPFDSIECEFSFALAESKKQVQFYKPLVACPFLTATEWEFVECNFSDIGTVQQNGFEVNTVTFSAKLWRKFDYYLTNLALPNIALFLLELTTFLMPADMSDRPIFSVTILLSLTVSHSNMVNQVPHWSGPVLLNDCFLGLIFIAAAVTFYDMVACFLASKYAKKMNRRVKRSNTKIINLVDFLVFLASLLGLIAIVIYAVLILSL